jgi:hypothetical protein
MADSLDRWDKRCNATDWLASLETYDVQYVILNVLSDRDLLRHVRCQPGWRVDFNDGGSAICVRDVAQTLPWWEES